MTSPISKSSILFCDQDLIDLGYEQSQSYPYENEDDETVYEKILYKHTTNQDIYRTRHQALNGQYYTGQGDHQDYPYKLPQMLRNKHLPIVIFDDEETADIAEEFGLPATCVADWKACQKHFQDREVIFCPGKDRQKAETGVGYLTNTECSVIIELPTQDFITWLHQKSPQIFEFWEIVRQARASENMKPLNIVEFPKHKILQELPDPIEHIETYETDKGIPKNTRPNIALALRMMGISLRYNQLTECIEMHGIKGFKGEIDDDAFNRIWLDLCEREGFILARELFGYLISDIAQSDRYHPIKDYLMSLKWDGVPRVRHFFTNVAQAKDTEFVQRVSEIWFTAAVRRVYEPGAEFQELIILEGAQGKSKSSAIRKLCKDEKWFVDDLPLTGSAKIAIEQTRGKWIVETAELDGKTNIDVRPLKRFLSATTDRARMAYGRFSKDYPRQWVALGTTNESEYLIDSTGNRRFWPINVKQFSVEKITHDYRDQLWAEALHLHLSGLSLKLEEDLWPEATQEQEERYNADPWEEKIVSLLPEGDCSIITGSVLEALGICVEKQDRKSSNRVARIMRRLGFEKQSARHPQTKKYIKVWNRGDGGPVSELTFFATMPI